MARKSNLLLIISLLFLVIIKALGEGNNRQPLSLKKAIEIAFKENQEFHRQQLNSKIALANSRGANATFLPQIEVSYNAMFTNNPLNAFGFKLQQGIVSQNDFNPSLLNDPGVVKDFSANLQIQQPIFNMDAILARSGAREISKVKKYSEERSREYLEFQVKQAYLKIKLSNDNLQVLVIAKKMAQALEEKATKFFEQELIKQSDLLEAKAYHLKIQSQLQTAQSDIQTSNDQMSLLLNRKIGTVYLVDSINWELHSTEMFNLKERADMKALATAVSANQYQVKAEKMKFIPRVNAFANYQLNDKQLFQFDKDSYLIGVKLSWKLFHGSQQYYKVKSAQFNRDKLISQLNEAEQKAEADYQKSVRQIENIRVEKNYTQLIIKQITEALRIEQNRYNQGLSSTTDLLKLQTQLAQQRLALAMTNFKRNINIAFLEFTVSNSK